MNVAPRLACQQCKQRKLRCDKGTPCSACRAAGLICQIVQRARLPRGKSGQSRKQKQTLESRLRQLETLLEQHNGNATLLPTCTDSSGSLTHGFSFMAPDFWTSLSESVSGLREILEDSENELEGESTGSNITLEQTGEASLAGAFMLFPNIGVKEQYRRPTLTVHTSRELLKLFRDRVGAVYKVVHWPTALASIEEDHVNSKSTVPNLGLEYAIYFTALCTVTNDEVDVMKLGVRAELLLSYQSAAEHFLASSRLLDAPDLTTLQGFVIYLIGLRTCLNSATTWTLVAVAVRVAIALRLGDEDPSKFTAFELELRRRVLYAIGILDTHAAFDRGTIPMLPASAFQTPPLEINDREMSLEGGVIAPSSSGITDMTHSMMTYEAMLCQRKIYELSRDGISNWSQRLQLVEDFGTYVEEISCRIGSSPAPMDLLLMVSGKKIHASLELLLRRPPYRQPFNAVPLSDSFDVMLAATKVLEYHLQASPPELSPWAWKNWIQWHALAVVLAELLERPSGPQTDSAIAVATNSFHYYAHIVADSQTGLLWKPIAKLMRRVQCIKQGSITLQAFSATYSAQEDVQRFSDSSLLDDGNVLDFTDWSIDEPTVASFRDQESQSLGLNHEQLPWLAWDAFLQDVANTSDWS